MHELHLTPEPATRDRQHLPALIEPGHSEAAAQKLGGDEARSGGDVEHVTPVRWEA